MPSVEDIIRGMRSDPANVRFGDLAKVCDYYFGDASVKGSHHKYKTLWPGDPRVNIQEAKGGDAKPYQVRQVLNAIDRLEAERAGEGQDEGEGASDDGEA